jgi:hypothetical protein
MPHDVGFCRSTTRTGNRAADAEALHSRVHTEECARTTRDERRPLRQRRTREAAVTEVVGVREWVAVAEQTRAVRSGGNESEAPVAGNGSVVT